MNKHILIAAFVGLAACATPQERCISNATNGLSEIDAQIAEAEANIARGYRLEDTAIDTVGVDFCSGSGNVRFCLGGEKEIPPRAVPIDVDAERGRLAALERQRASMVQRMERQIEACREI